VEKINKVTAISFYVFCLKYNSVYIRNNSPVPPLSKIKENKFILLLSYRL